MSLFITVPLFLLPIVLWPAQLFLFNFFKNKSKLNNTFLYIIHSDQLSIFRTSNKMIILQAKKKKVIQTPHNMTQIWISLLDSLEWFTICFLSFKPLFKPTTMKEDPSCRFSRTWIFPLGKSREIFNRCFCVKLLFYLKTLKVANE